MVLLSLLRSLCRNIFRRRRVERDLDDEVRACFALLEEEKIQHGMPPHAARRAATVELGRVDSVKEEVRRRRPRAGPLRRPAVERAASIDPVRALRSE